MFISLFRRLTFCASALSSIFGVRFRRALSVVDGHFFKAVKVAAAFEFVGVTAVVAVPNSRKGETVIGRNSGSSASVGLFALNGLPPVAEGGIGEAR